MKSQKELIHSIDWDILLLLDACRYDYFKKHIYDFVDDGELIKARSEGSDTNKWLTGTWTDFYPDITYISGNPFINSKNVAVGGFNGLHHFDKVIDVWDFGFDKKTGRVEASKINDSAYNHINGGRYILHYQQPHEPYIFLKKHSSYSIKKLLRHFIPIKLQWWFVSLHPFFRRKLVEKKHIKMFEGYRVDKILLAYERNLFSVLKAVQEIIELYPDKTIVVTADHGEYLGENGQFGHGGKLTEFITTVPFYVVGRRKNE